MTKSPGPAYKMKKMKLTLESSRSKNRIARAHSKTTTIGYLEARERERESLFSKYAKQNIILTNVNTLPSLGQYAPLIRLRRMALYKSVLID